MDVELGEEREPRQQQEREQAGGGGDAPTAHAEGEQDEAHRDRNEGDGSDERAVALDHVGHLALVASLCGHARRGQLEAGEGHRRPARRRPEGKEEANQCGDEQGRRQHATSGRGRRGVLVALRLGVVDVHRALHRRASRRGLSEARRTRRDRKPGSPPFGLGGNPERSREDRGGLPGGAPLVRV